MHGRPWPVHLHTFALLNTKDAEHCVLPYAAHNINTIIHVAHDNTNTFPAVSSSPLDSSSTACYRLCRVDRSTHNPRSTNRLPSKKRRFCGGPFGRHAHSIAMAYSIVLRLPRCAFRIVASTTMGWLSYHDIDRPIHR